jgi:hypothetical protein
LGKDTPQTRPVEHKPTANTTVISLPLRADGANGYARQEAA